jgi:hypothetical protein
MDAFDFPPGFALEANNLAIDFDGVIHNADKGYFDGTCYGDPIPGSLSALRELSKKYRIVIFTAKAKPNRPLIDGKSGTQLVSEWLEKYCVLQYIAEITSEKPRAILYIDDNAFRFENWHDTLVFTETL